MDAVKLEEATMKVGGRFKLTVLIQKRLLELKRGAPKLVEISPEDPLDIILEEILQEKIALSKDEIEQATA
ncbi:MAG: DNA-directed RNA polymerase subunit omega [Planctomycetes bacterium]|nr:DNA-directed RNA polymerase subunit omega [Planctomycetota bacterium]